jgi:carbon-monoxide dehydrogenase medium subunit
MRHVAHLAIRNRGTIGGSLSHADPAAELPMMAVLLDAQLNLASLSAGERSVQAQRFFVDALTADLNDDEMLIEIVLPRLPPRTGWGFEEVARRGGDFALAAAGAIITAKDGLMADARIAVMGVDKTPLRMPEAEALLTGSEADPVLFEKVSNLVRQMIRPETDLHASSDYRRHLTGVLVRRTLADAWRRAGGTTV